MTVHAKARIPALMDTVVTDRMDLDLDISQGAINGCDFTTPYPDCYRITPC